MDFSLIIEADGIKIDNIQDVIKRSYEMGYECVAINTIINSSNLSGKNINIPEPKHINFEGKFGRKYRILSRLTAVIEDPIHAHHLMKSPVTKKYDILAVQPIGEKVLRHVVSQVDVDIVSLNLSKCLGFTLKKTHIGLAFQKSICFEISYAPYLREDTQDTEDTHKRWIISNAQMLVDACKGRNIIISSGAVRPLELRSPEDVTNLGLLFGLKNYQAVQAVRKNGDTLIAHAGTRNKTGCGITSFTDCLKMPEEERWIEEMCKVPLSTKTLSKSNKRKFEQLFQNYDKKYKRKESE